MEEDIGATGYSCFNKTNIRIFYRISKNDSLPNSNPLRIIKEDTIWEESSMIYGKSKMKEAMLGRNGWVNFINSECKDSVLRLFVFNDSLILNENWDSIYKSKNYSKLIKYPVRDLEKQNW